MIGINITKDKYYCCRFFKIQRKKHLKDLKKGYGLSFIRDVAEDLEELEKNAIKAKTEELLMKKVKTLTDKKIRFVCYEGRYSNSRTIFINNLKIKRIDNLLEILKKK